MVSLLLFSNRFEDLVDTTLFRKHVVSIEHRNKSTQTTTPSDEVKMPSAIAGGAGSIFAVFGAFSY
jgi:hypothetical protein